MKIFQTYIKETKRQSQHVYAIIRIKRGLIIIQDVQLPSLQLDIETLTKKL